MEYVGHAPDYAQVVFRGDVEKREFIAFWLDAQNRVLAGMNVNVWDVVDEIKAMIRSRQPATVTQLTDLQIPLTTSGGD
jgi:3-phenylpropionate/trans-cinnamate dioxygenase ferredoxin reductase subunit